MQLTRAEFITIPTPWDPRSLIAPPEKLAEGTCAAMPWLGALPAAGCAFSGGLYLGADDGLSPVRSPKGSSAAAIFFSAGLAVHDSIQRLWQAAVSSCNPTPSGLV